MAFRVIGEEGCKIPKIIDTMMRSPARGELLEKWSSICITLDFENDVLGQLRRDIMQLRPELEDLYAIILTKWVGTKKEKKATLGDLVKALESKGLNDIVRCIKEQFYKVNSEETVPDSGKLSKLQSSSHQTQSSVQIPISVTSEELDFIKNITPFDVIVTRPTSLIKRDDHYSLPKLSIKGLALIINVIEFDNPDNQRTGATNDTKYMYDLWTALGYRVTKNEGYFKDIENIMTSFIEEIEEYKDEIKSCVAFIGSHGEHGSIALSDDTEINVYEDFIYKLTALEALKGKPKIFIVQACQYFPRTKKDKKGGLVMPCEDTMICFSTIPGEGSNRDPYLGTWYVNCLTRVFMKNAWQMDLEQMLDETQRTMRDIVTDEDKGQLPYHQKFLMEKLYFNMPLEKNVKKT